MGELWIPLLAGFGVIVWQHRATSRKRWSPLWLAFSTTLLSTIYTGAGIIGYSLNKHERFVQGTPWTDDVIWSQVAIGVCLVVVAAVCWRRGLRSLAHSPT